MGKDAARLQDFLHHLSQTDRYILLLHQADGLTVPEIALVLELPPTRVETRLGALRARARALLAAEPAPSPDVRPVPVEGIAAAVTA